MSAKPVMRNHSSHGAFDQQFGMASTACPDIFGFVAADVARKAHVSFLFLFFSSEPNFLRVDDNYKIPCVHMWRENRLSLPAQQVGGLDRDTTKHLVFGVDEPPLARHLRGLGRKGFHG